MSGLGSDVRVPGASPDVLTPARWRIRLRRVLVVIDASVIGFSSLAAYLLRTRLGVLPSIGPLQNEVPVALAVLPLWLTILYLLGCYQPARLNAGGEAFRRFLGATLAGTVALGFLSYLLRLDLSRLYVGLLFLFVLVLGTAARTGVRRFLRQRRVEGRLIQNVLLVGCDDEARDLVSAIRMDPGSGYRVVGVVADQIGTGGELAGAPVLGGIKDLLDIAVNHRVGLVLLSPTGVEPGTLQEVVIALEDSPIDVAVAPSLFQVVTRRVTVETVANVAILHVGRIRLTRSNAIAKRTLDVLGASVLVALLWPVMLVAAFAVKRHDGGPIFFVQKRVGRDGRVFHLLKFRTMHPGAEDRLSDVESLNEAGQHFFKIRADPRVTNVGRFLRKWSIDETPQLWNVLRADMSLVGPRPPLPDEVQRYEPWHLRRLRVKPGVTGIWQVSGRSNVPFNEAVRMDLFYIENWSLGLDVTVLAKTILAVLGRRGAW